MKEIKPFTVVLYIFGVLVLLAPIVYFVPEKGWNVEGLKFSFLTKQEIYHPKKQEKTDISDIIAAVDTTMLDEQVDPILHKDGSKGDFGAPSEVQIFEIASTELFMNDNGKKNLHTFFETLSNVASEKKKISILHYGDSQIEGDRMTGHIRQMIQNQFGGNGPGLIPATNVYSTITFTQTFSENFERYTCFGGKKLKVPNYGAMASVARFTPEYEGDSIAMLDSLLEQTGWIEFGPSNSAYARAQSYNNVKMAYNSCIAPTKLRVYQNGEIIHEENLIQDGAQHTFKLSFPTTPGKLKYEFTGKISPNICAFSLEGDYGVQVSNIAMRGSSGTVFRYIRHNTLTPMYDEMNTKMVILQFGGNSVPFFKDSTAVRNFASYFKSQINTVKKLNPGAMVIVIGPSDMSDLKDGIYSTYKFLPYCVEKMKEATASAGGAYWNMYAAMGGKNAMPSWVDKGLAGKDYIHFSNGGAKVISKLFYSAFIAEYAKWKKI